MTNAEAIALAKDLFGTRDSTNVWTTDRMLRLLGRAQRVFMGKLGQLNQGKVSYGLRVDNVGGGVAAADGIELVSDEETPVTLDTVSAVLWYPNGDMTRPAIPLPPVPWRAGGVDYLTVGNPQGWFVNSSATLRLYMTPYPSSSGTVLVVGQPRLAMPTSTTDAVCNGHWPELHDLVVCELCVLMAVSANDRINVYSGQCEEAWQYHSALIAMNAARSEDILYGDSY